MNYAVGHNLVGYMPESDVFITADWESARNALIADLEWAQDQDAEIDYDDAASLDDVYAESIAELRALAPDSEYGTIIGNTSWWINETDEMPDDEDS